MAQTTAITGWAISWSKPRALDRRASTGNSPHFGDPPTMTSPFGLHAVWRLRHDYMDRARSGGPGSIEDLHRLISIR